MCVLKSEWQLISLIYTNVHRISTESGTLQKKFLIDVNSLHMPHQVSRVTFFKLDSFHYCIHCIIVFLERVREREGGEGIGERRELT